MPEVIELLSSSPPRSLDEGNHQPLLPTNTRPSNLSSGVCNTFGSSAFGDEDFDAIFNSSTIKKYSTRLSQQTSSRNPRPKDTAAPVTIDSDDFKDSEEVLDNPSCNLNDEELPNFQPAKRRRISPHLAPSPTRVQKSLAEVEAVFDLSSEPDYVTFGPSKAAERENEVEVLALSEDDFEMPSFSSSAPLPRTSTAAPSRDKYVAETSMHESMFFDDPITSSSQPVKTARSKVLSDRTTNLPASLNSPGKYDTAKSRVSSTANQGSSRMARPKMSTTLKLATVDFDNIIDSSQPAARASNPVRAASPVPAKSKGTGSKSAVNKEQSRLDKEAAKEQKRLEKERKAADKRLATDKAEANKRKTDKKKTTEEMIIELPTVIKGKSLGNQVEELMSQVDVETRYYQLEVDMTNDDSAPIHTGSVMKWRRKVKSRYNEQLEEYESCQLKLEREKHILVHLTAEEMCTIAVVGPTGQSHSPEDASTPSEEAMKTNIDTYITLLRSRNPNVTIILQIQGLNAFLKKSANGKNREYAAAVRAQTVATDQATSSTTTKPSKKRKTTSSPVDLTFLTSDHAEALTLHLQLSHQPIHIHHTTSVATSAQQIVAFTQHLSTRPYRLTEQAHNLAHASFCMASGQFKTGQGDTTETFLKMLEQVNRITPSMALGILNEGYATPKDLVAGFLELERSATGGGASLSGNTREEREGRERAKLMLQDIRKALNKDGGYADKRLGPAASKRLYRVFMSRDENLRDGII